MKRHLAHAPVIVRSGWRTWSAPRRAVVSKAELVWMPTYLVTIRLTSPKGDGETICSVDACSGAFALFQMAADIEEADSPVETFPPSLSEREAEAVARESLVAVPGARQPSQTLRMGFGSFGRRGVAAKAFGFTACRAGAAEKLAPFGRPPGFPLRPGTKPCVLATTNFNR